VIRRAFTLVLVALALALSACKVDTTVTVRVRDDGGGTVTARVVLDADAVKAVEIGGAKLPQAVRLADLRAAGWRTSTWRRLPGGGARLQVGKDFARAEDAAAVVAELSGPDGPLEVVVGRKASRFKTEWTFSGVGDLKDLRTGVSSDADLVARLSGARVDVAALDRRLLREVRDAVRLRVVADLPEAGPRTFVIPPGARRAMHTASSKTDVAKISLLGFGALLGLIAVVLLVVGESRRRRRAR
jgi:hypothetical protein